MTDLANEIYRQLLRRVRSKTKSITYQQLASETSRKVSTHHRQNAFYRALGEITAACRDANVPAVTAIVWKANACHPGEGYYAVAHPRAKDPDAAWEREHEAVVAFADKYPSSL